MRPPSADPALDPAFTPPEWYERVGFKCGLEVHQQLLTDRKLFCRCPAGLYTTTHDATILRHMRPTLSELGGYDGTALMEFRTRKRIIYLLDRRVVCTYEMDDTPPMLVDQAAIDCAIEQCLMLGCDIVDEIHIARKQYLDGSIPTGFQRTAVVGVNGGLPFRGRTLDIIQVTVEEDSCREVSDAGHLIVWRADRLGTPLIETVTEPQLLQPDEVEEAILLVGRVCRNTRHVRTGIGASRQDVNVSVRGGTRVEIKGVPKAGWAPALVRGEAIRQVRLLELRDLLAERGVSEDSVETEVLEIDPEAPLDRESWEAWTDERGYTLGRELGDGPFTVAAIVLRNCGGLVSHPTQPGKTFADELRGRVRVVAGLDVPPIVLADGEDPLVDAVRARLSIAEGDGLVLVRGPREDTVIAAEEIRDRLQQATQGIPQETRQPFEDGSTDFERILPGPDRMYPDTDSPPTRVMRDRVERLRDALPAPPWEREARYAAAGVPTPVIHWLIRRGGAALVDAAAPEGSDPATLKRACFFFGERMKGWKRAGLHTGEAVWAAIFGASDSSAVLHDVLPSLVAAICGGEGYEAAIGRLIGAGPPEGWQDEVRRDVADGAGEYPNRTPEARVRHHVGRALGRLRGRVAARDVLAVVEQHVSSRVNT